MPLETFEEKLDSLEVEETPSVLLANGFSQAWNHNIFNYENLLQRANFGARNRNIKGIFNKFETFDFEQVMRALEAAETVCESYGVNRAKIDEIRADQEQLKNSLIQVISQTHPLRSSSVTVAQYEAAKPFIIQFENIFTLNYDLLLYWIVNKSDIDPEGYFTDDGFRRTTWENMDDQNVFFLHGGLHIYDTETRIKKQAFRGQADESIVDQVRDNLNQGKFPLFVSEPTHQKKRSRIEHNPYLNSCFKALKKLSGPLFIHGHSMAENDKHIFDQINESDVDKVFISIFGDENSDANKETMANARRFIDADIEFYDASTAPIWQ
ncbi:DUF4917 domain-containing protein [Vibrio splendidus]|uniref:DUF4917 family protein n=1 Tax=Vibrio TaxID=662 RepID=UPI000D343FBC|nr:MULTISPECIES: DUF4917 family protein [Vibrio]MDN2668948.1 DUF4917 family protein [Vibrio sp. 14N.309.X.WAT.E.F5]PTO86514.1 DUF4917 domain-containing protein [Vibrio splendidus]